MLETVDLSRTYDRARYERSYPQLRDRLALLQRAVFEEKIPVVMVFEGWDTAGKGDTIEKLVARVDPRGYVVHAIRPPTEEEELHPFLWRFWNRLPERGGMAIFDHSWYGRVLADRVEKRVGKRACEEAFDEINQFERTLTDDGTVVLKFFLHISKAEQKRRYQKLEKDRYQSWRVTKKDWAAHRDYERHRVATEEMLARTSTSWAPWTVIPATDKYLRRMEVFEKLATVLEEALDLRHARAADPAPPSRPAARKAGRTILDSIDLSVRLTPTRYEAEVKRWQDRLRELEYASYAKRLPVIAAFEGWDAAGKGGAIRRLVGALDPRGYTVLPIAAPKGDDATHHYLWRFWRRLPKAGHLAVFDRTWYGRVLVERVEGFCTEAEWQRAYHEINEFERSLVNGGAVLVKYWLHVSPEVQLKRFKAREKDPAKRYKITDEDWRNREKWDAYELAVHDMITRTSTRHAPWTIVEANDKSWARVKCLQTLVEEIEKRL
jgi:polyphosphate:AMP phosphotransferase